MNSFTPAPVLTNNPNVSASSVTSNISRFSADTMNALTKLTGATSSAVSNNISKLSGATSSAIMPKLSSVSSSSSSDNNSGFLNMSVTTWLIIIMILAFLGINVFVYLAKGTQDITSFFKPLIEKIIVLFGAITSKIVNVSAGGVKGVVDTTASVVDTGLTAVQEATSLPSQPVKDTIPQSDNVQNSSLNKELNTSKQTKQSNTSYEADESSSKIKNKSGWCYIGEDRGFRSCAKVGENDDCMSGDIFPSQEICVNPNLRA